MSTASVLLVDDNRDNLVALASVLEGLAEEVVTARSGREALRLVLAQEFAVILLDVRMPEMDGFETMRELRRIQSLKNLPIIAVTAKAMKGDRERCIEAGAWDYLAKPVDPEELVAMLRAWLVR